MSYDHEVAVTVPRRGDGKYLILQRAPHKPSPGIWTFPGGTVEQDETPREAALRELREETGLDADIVGETESFDREVRGEKHLMHYFLVEVEGGLELNEEHQDFAWIEIGEIEKYETVGDYTGIKKLGLVEGG